MSRPAFTVTGQDRPVRAARRQERISDSRRPVPLSIRRQTWRDRGRSGDTKQVHSGGTGRIPIGAVARPSAGEPLSEVETVDSRAMPSMTLRATWSQSPTGERAHGEPTTGTSSETGGRGEQPSSGRSAGRAGPPVGRPVSERAVRRPEWAGTPQSGARQSGRGATPPVGRDASTLYPEFTFKTLAPRIDVTRPEDPDRRDITYRDTREDRREPTEARVDVEDLFGATPLERSTYPSDIRGLVEKLRRDMDRRRRIERERRGL